MQRTLVKYLVMFFLLMTYINRGLFVAGYEIENQGNKETNSVIEWIMQMITGKENGIDEDGDVQSNCSFVAVFQHDFSEQITKNFDLANLFSKKIEFVVSREENIPQSDFYDKIDRPPEV